MYVGIMSGTSMDGIDAALVDFSAPIPRLAATHYVPYEHDLSARLLALQTRNDNELHVAARLGVEITRLYASAVKSVLAKAGLGADSVQAIGCHGQTVRHNPREGYTVQLGNPALLAELSGIDVVADFRSRDIAAGGQGAPLVPAFHEAVFRHPGVHRVILNVGGFSNVTNLDPFSATSGFDTGPGNVLLDAWTRRCKGKAYDEGGEWSAEGHVIPQLLDDLLSHPFFLSDPPKSCGREQFNLDWLESHLSPDFAAVDVQATLLELTASSIAKAVQEWIGVPAELVVCGGGAHNRVLLRRLSELMPHTQIVSSDDLGVGADWVEAMAFAWLARQALLGRTGNLPVVTGSRGPRVLGAIYPR